MYGAAGADVARAVAGMLGYRVLDDELPVAVAARLGTTSDLVSSMADRAPDFGERLLAGFATAVPESAAPAPPPDADVSADVRREIERQIRAAAEGDALVIVGRGAGTILGPRSDVVRALAVAPLEWRVARVRASLQVDDAVARSEVRRIDEARSRYVTRLGAVWAAATTYDITVDPSRLGIEGAAGAIVAAVRGAEGRRA